MQIVPQHHDGDIHAIQQIRQVVSELRQLGVAVLELVVDGGELFIGGLQLLL